MSNNYYNTDYYKNQLNELKAKKLDLLKEIYSLKGYCKSLDMKIEKVQAKYDKEYQKELECKLNSPVIEF